MQDSLHTLLHKWKVEPAPNPDFRAEVWGRIAERKRRFSYRIWSRTEDIVGQPAWATVVVAVMLIAGATTGNVWQKREERHVRTAGLRAYVLAVNPVAHAASFHR
ncbi:MAG: hypothetical protein Q7S40_07080 [Opitutaceae bacterium]|nr:hypothetical protein [Opitutaceae bacterium]